MNIKTSRLGVHVPEILLPNPAVDLSKWSVVACDQYTSQPEYWEEVEKTVGNGPSTLKVTLPEVFLENLGTQERIKKINVTMKKYLSEQVLTSQKDGFVYIDRSTSHSASRKGLIIAVDLEEYDYNKGSQTLIRATEGTVIERLPPRVKIRENASIELPHIMLLIDDPEKSVIEPIADMAEKLEKLYDFDLMMNGGHIKGYKVDDEALLSNIFSALEKLSQPAVFKAKYNVGDDKGTLLFAVGDGNHSLASAKAFWEKVKKELPECESANHPARFALVEVVNVHDEGLEFEPIHRVVFNVDAAQMLDKLVQYYQSEHTKAYSKNFDCETSLNKELQSLRMNEKLHVLPFITADFCGMIVVENPKYNLEVGTLQCFLDEFIKTDSQIKIDYIHGEDVVKSLGSQKGNIGFFMPAMDKCDLFKTVVLDGTLPRKTFSMGEAEEKRFYLECRKIVKD